MKHVWILGCLLLCLCLPSCQCSDKPDVGPVEGTTAAMADPGAQRAAL